MKKAIRLEDWITIIFCLFMAYLTFAKRENIPHWKHKVLIDMMIVALSVVIPITTKDKDNKLSRFLRCWYPVAAVAMAFFNLRGVVEGINPNHYDQQLIAIDRWLFGGVDPTQWLQRFSRPWLDEYLQLAYISYYFIPILTGIGLYSMQDSGFTQDMEPFRRAVVIFLLTFYLSYIGYLLVPAVGPRFTLHYTKELNGVLLTPYLKKMINILEPTHNDCFPSGHTAVSVVALFIAFRYRRRLFWYLLPVVLSLILSTVYHRYHYVIDVIAGVVLSVIAFFLGEWLFNLVERE